MALALRRGSADSIERRLRLVLWLYVWFCATCPVGWVLGDCGFLVVAADTTCSLLRLGHPSKDLASRDAIQHLGRSYLLCLAS